MSEHDLEKLLGGFAADTLTPKEKQTLYSAALQDQELFNALADEQALKELLADPAVRRRLLASLERKSTSGSGGSLPWLDWFRRPAGLAFAGGLTAAALAVVLGIRIYQDSLKQATQPVATEGVKPATPPASAPQASESQITAQEPIEPAIAPAKKGRRADKMVKRERAETPSPQEQRASDVARDSQKQETERDQVPKQAETPVAALSKSAEEVTSSADRKLAASAAPSAASAPANAPFAGAVTAAVSARSLFYGGEPGRADQRAMAKEQEQAMKPLTESAPQANRLERKMDQSAQAGKAAGTATQLHPLGLRYSFVVHGANGQDREVDTATALKSAEPVRLTVETNQAAYLQIWMRAATSTPQLLVPQKESGQISQRIAAGQRQNIPLPTESGPLTLTTRLSRVPFGPITRQEAAMFDRLSPNQLQESITAIGPPGSQEQATYVVNQDPSPAAQISVEILLSR